jgi:SAM-dependent methyltransferase
MNIEIPSGYLDPEREVVATDRLRAYLTRIGQHDVERNVAELMAIQNGGFVDRFNYFIQHLDRDAYAHVMISGCSVGSEAALAKLLGFKRVSSTEVTEEYVSIARDRFAHQPELRFYQYDGQTLPFRTGEFSMLISGHIIEHTPSPRQYLAEHLRVLAPGGFCFIEFPNRYHPWELHTNLPSCEYLPLPLRNGMLRLLASRFSPYSPEQRQLFDLVRRTLQPVSIGFIARALRCLPGPRSRIIHCYQPRLGFVRMVIRKGQPL